MLTEFIAQLLYVAIDELHITMPADIDRFFLFSARYDLRQVWS